MSGNNTTATVQELEPEDGGDGVNYSGHFQTDTVFSSFDDAVEWANGIARPIGFLFTKSSYKSSHDGRPIRYLACDRRKKRTERNLESAIRKNTKSKANSCPFYIKVEYERITNGWKIFCKNDITGTHNHPFTVYPEGYRQISGLSPGAKQVVRDMTNAHVPPRNIMATLKEKYPNDHPNIRHVYNYRSNIRMEKYPNDHPNIRHVYNYRSNIGMEKYPNDHPNIRPVYNNRSESSDIRMERSEGREFVQEVLDLARESKYITWVMSDTNNVIMQAFMAHPDTMKLLRTYPYVIGMDSTYKTNEYDMPFFDIVGVTPINRNFLVGYVFMRSETEESYRWVLEKLRVLIGNEREPSVFLSDGEVGLCAALRSVFPKTTHLFCRWHINKEVEAYVTALFKNMSMGFHFTNERWKHAMDAASEAEYEQALQRLKAIWGGWPEVIEYIEGTWLVHKEKFVKCWTDQVLHFGYVNNCRVESQHSPLKYFLDSATGDLDTIWAKVHKQITAQISGIRSSLSACRLKLGMILKYKHHVPLQHLNGAVSYHCLSILDAETVRMREFNGEVHQRCGCSLRVTHGIPCACRIHTLIVTKTKYYLDQIHPFWKSLNINTCVDMPESTTEYIEQSILGKVHNYISISDCRYVHLLPGIILPYLVGWKDVTSDGNCGFRCVADFFMGDQDNWRLIRQTIANEIAAFAGLYSKIYCKPCGLDYEIWRIRWNGGSCEETHWMEVIQDLFPIATFFNATVIFYAIGFTRNDVYPCCTVLPLRALGTATAPKSEFVIAIVGGSHVIHLELERDHPIPPIADFWFRFRESSVAGWEQLYEHRINLWNRLAASF